MINRIKTLAVALLFLLPSSLLSFSQEKSDDYHIKVPKFSSPPKIDGKLENPLWEKGAVLDTFTQYEPQEGAQPSEKTVAYLGYDQKNFYIALRCFDSGPKGIRTSLTQRDRIYGDDEVTIYLDTFNDKKRAFVFQLNALGIQTDGIFSETGRRQRGDFSRIDKNWDTFFLSKGDIDDQGYTVELAIPFKSVRFPNTPSQTWGFQIMRTIRRKNEEIYLFPRSRDVNGLLIQSGTIEIEGVIEKGKNLEIIPILTGLMESGKKIDPEEGLNLKYGITSDLTADITYNPDFSQVEADMPQIEVNQRYPLYYPEKRPFFLEGKDFFETPLELAYTRQIVNPRWGVKLTGKVGRTTIGFLSALDETPPYIDIPYPSSTSQDPFDKALVNVFRFKRDLFLESYIGFIITDKEMGSSWNSLSSNYNRVGGIDGHFKFKKYYRFSFQILGSQSKVGNIKTDLVPAMKFDFSHISRHLNFSADWTSIHPEFEGSAGFFRRKDIHSFNTRLRYGILPQNDFIISIWPSIEYERIYDFNQTLVDEEFTIGGFMNGWRQSFIWGGFSSSLERYEGIDFYKKNFRISLRSEPFSWLTGNVRFSFGNEIYYSENPYLGYITSLEFRVTLKPTTYLRLFYNFENNEFYKEKGGEKVYKINIISQRINFQLSRYLTLRLITDYNDYDKTLYNNILFIYEPLPGTVFYLGVDDNQERGESGIFQKKSRFYFIKFSYWWRI